MKCPRCHEPLLVLDLDGVEIDRCPGCGGMWLDPGELDTLGELAGLGEHCGHDFVVRSAAPAASQGSAGPCPRCRRRLSPFAWPGVAGLQLDRCPRGHGWWFDPAELGHTLTTLCEGPAEARALANFLREMLAGELMEPPPQS